MDYRDGKTSLYQEGQGFVDMTLDQKPVLTKNSPTRSEEWFGGQMNNLDPVLLGTGSCAVLNGTGDKEAFHAV
jgi:hypothetical protein